MAIFIAHWPPPTELVKFNMIKIIVVDDHLPTLHRISHHIRQLKKYEILTTVPDGFDLLKFCRQQKVLPDIVLLDLLMPKMDGISTMEYMNNYFPAIKVIGVSSFESEQVVIDLLSGGAWGYVFKDKGLDMLTEALNEVLAGRPYIDPRIPFDASQRVSLMQKRREEKEVLYNQMDLSPREKELLGLIVSTMDYNEIGELLNIAPKTIENTIYSINQKMGVTNGRTGLTMHSIRLGISKMMHFRSDKNN